MMYKLLGILLMVIFGVSGVGATVLAWLLPWLNLDKTEATIAGLIGIGFLVFQGFLFKHSKHDTTEQVSVEVQAKDNNN
jgi:hypothetical protein